MKLTLGGADQFELEAEENERRILRMLSGGAAAPLAYTRSARSVTRRSPLDPQKAGPAGPLTANAGGGGSVVLAGVRFRVKVRAASSEPTIAQAGPVARAKLQSPAVQVAAKSIGGGRSRGADLARALDQSAGQPLPEHVRRVLEPAFGQSFANVRIHLDEQATMAASAVSAEAFTLGRDVYFNRGYFDPSSPRGIALIGHELTHVAQNAGGVRIQRSALDDAMGFTSALDGAVARYGGDVSFEDPQKKLSWDYYMNTGSAAFNRAPGGEEATARLEKWLRAKVQQGVSLNQQDVILEAIVENKGRVTLAMGSLAEILCKAQNRSWAGRIKGLKNDGKDYYRFAGAYVGLQGNVLVREAGSLGSHANILGNPLVYTGGGLWDMGKGVVGLDRRQVSQGWNEMAARWKPGPNLDKLYEFNLGMIAAEGWREHEQHKGFYEKLERLEDWFTRSIKRKGLTVAGNDASEQQAVANERAIYTALMTGAQPKVRATPVAVASPATFTIRRSGLDEGSFDVDDLFITKVTPDELPIMRELNGIRIRGSPRFVAKVCEQLDEIGATKTGRRLLDGIKGLNQARGHKVTIVDRLVSRPLPSSGSWFDDGTQTAGYYVRRRNVPEEAFVQGLEGEKSYSNVFRTITKLEPGQGMSGIVFYDPWLTLRFPGTTLNMPDTDPVTVLFHELGHAGGAAAGRWSQDIGGVQYETRAGEITSLEEAINTGLTREKFEVSENSFRAERGLPKRPFYGSDVDPIREIAPDAPERAARLATTREDYNKMFAKRLPRDLKPDPTYVPRGPVVEAPRGGFVAKIIEKVSSMADRVLSKMTALGEGARYQFNRFIAQRPWLEDLMFGPEYGIFSRILPQVREFFGGLSTAARSTDLGMGVMLALGKVGKFLFTAFKGLAGFLAKVAGPLAATLDFVQWFQGPSSLLDRANPEMRKKLAKGDDKAWAITNFYYAPLAFLDTLMAVTALIPPLEPVAAVAGGLSILWQGVDLGWVNKHLKFGGVGMPLANAIFRKRRGSSQYSDEDPEVEQQYRSAVRRYGREPGVSLDWSTKSRLERFLGRDLGEVRLHTGPLATEVARATEAEALTYGRDIYIPSDKLGSAEGMRLLAHEATHVAQAGPATPTASPRSLGAGAGVEAMEDVARSIEARFTGAAARAYPVIAEPVVREAPGAPVAVAGAAAAPAVEEVAAPVAAPAEAVQRHAIEASAAQTPGFDPVAEVLQRLSVTSAVSQEEFLELCTERLIELMKDEIELDASRRETLNWNGEHPSV